MTRARKGFTLVELLVVIAIIAVLIGVLLPALNRARKASHITACASNLRQIGVGIINYAQNHKGLLPPPFRNGSSGPPPNPGTYTPEDCYRFEGGAFGRASYALLYDGKFCSDPKVFYCPAYPNPAFDYNSFPYPWSTAPLPSGWNWRASYLYLPHFEWATLTLKKPAYVKLQQVPRNRTLAMDIAFDIQYISHMNAKRKNDASWNLLFKDGHVAMVSSQFLYDVIDGRYASMGLPGGNTQKGFQAPTEPANGGRGGFDNYRDILETTAEGLDPRTSTVGGGLPFSANRVKHAPPPLPSF